jgi:chromate transporter
VWSRVALLSFGGPAGQIAVMHRILVDEQRWIGERRFLHALNFCMLLPGPEAQQLATYLGWLLHGWRGGLAAGALFIIPGFVAILGLSMLYAAYQDTRVATALFYGLKPAVVAVVIAALLRIGRRTLRGLPMVLLAAAAFIAMFVLRIHFVAVVAGAAAVGLLAGRRWPEPAAPRHAPDANSSPPAIPDEQLTSARPSLPRAIGIVAGGVALWWLPVLLLAFAVGGAHVLIQLGVFFGKVAVVSFGGAYAVLAYVADEAVRTFAWLEPTEMLDGLGMAETTPGPLIMVVQFVGFLAAYRNPGGLDSLWAGVIASVLVTWVTFVPSFMWIFLGAPYVERLRENRPVVAALSAITAAVVGVILNLAVWFGLHVLFGRVDEARWGTIRLLVPDLSTWDPVATSIAAGAFVLMQFFRWGLLRTMLAAALVGAAWAMARG